MNTKSIYHRVSGGIPEGVTTSAGRSHQFSTLFACCVVVREWQTCLFSRKVWALTAEIITFYLDETFSRNSGWQISSTDKMELICKNGLFISGLGEVGFSSRSVVTK